MAEPLSPEKLRILLDHARAGDVGAMTEVGKRMLAAPPPAPRQGLAMLDTAAHRGGGDAALVLAAMAGAGFHTEQSWPTALSYLGRAGEAGSEFARRQIALLSGRPVETIDDWLATARTIDVAPWLVQAPEQPVCEAPRIGMIAGFLPPEVCDWLIVQGRERLARAKVFDHQTGAAVVHDVRTNSAAEFLLEDSDLVLLLVQTKIGAFARAPYWLLEPPNILHYEVGQEFKPHFDWFNADEPGEAAEMRARGQRVLTFLVYLNAGFEGGETDFPEAAQRFKGAKGQALYFHNADASGNPAPLTRHAGLAPTKGEKWILSQWVRAAPTG